MADTITVLDGIQFEKDSDDDVWTVDGGVIVFDDIGPDGCNLKDVWEDFKNSYLSEFEFTENYDGKGIGCAIKR